MRRLLSLLLIGTAVAAGGSAVAAAQSRSRPPAAFGSPATAPSESLPAPSRSIPTTARLPIAARTASAPRAGISIGFQPTAMQLPGLAPAAVTPILSVGGQLQPPDDPARVGWWQGGALAGSPAGSFVLVGHVDSARYGPGALYRLDQVKAGSVVRVSDGGRAATYRIRSLGYVPKSAGLPAGLFRASGAPQLVLISCGGSFDRTTLSYRDNVVVVADLQR